MADHTNTSASPTGTRFRGLDPVMVTIVERGHSMSDGQWAEFPFGQLEYKVSASEWLFNSTSQAYVLYDRDYDAHTPLLIEEL